MINSSQLIIFYLSIANQVPWRFSVPFGSVERDTIGHKFVTTFLAAMDELVPFTPPKDT